MDEEKKYCTTKDLMILSHLRQDSRTKLTDMSRETRIPVSTIHDKIRNYKETGLIKKNTSIVNFERFGYTTQALVFLTAYRDDKEKLAELLRNNSHVNSLFKINNGWDLAAEVIFSNMKEIEDFLEKLEEKILIRDKKIFYIVHEMKREEFMSKPTSLALSLL